MGRPRFTDADWQTLRLALSYAIVERESFADATRGSADDREHHDRAQALVDRFEALNVKMFGVPSYHREDMNRFSEMPTVSIHELMGGDTKI